MKLSKTTIEACEDKNIQIYTATKKTNKFGKTWISCVFAVKLNSTTVTTKKTTSFEGTTQQDIVDYFCTMYS